jgi:hypothetical protein
MVRRCERALRPGCTALASSRAPTEVPPLSWRLSILV